MNNIMASTVLEILTLNELHIRRDNLLKQLEKVNNQIKKRELEEKEMSNIKVEEIIQTTDKIIKVKVKIKKK